MLPETFFADLFTHHFKEIKLQKLFILKNCLLHFQFYFIFCKPLITFYQ